MKRSCRDLEEDLLRAGPTLEGDLFEDVEDGLLSASGQGGDALLRQQQVQQFGRVRETALVVHGAAKVQTAQRVAQPVEAGHLPFAPHNINSYSFFSSSSSSSSYCCW